MAEERKLQVGKVDVFQLRMNVAADVGVSYVNTWLAFNLLPAVTLLGVLKQKLCPVQKIKNHSQILLVILHMSLTSILNI